MYFAKFVHWASEKRENYKVQLKGQVGSIDGPRLGFDPVGVDLVSLDSNGMFLVLRMEEASIFKQLINHISSGLCEKTIPYGFIHFCIVLIDYSKVIKNYPQIWPKIAHHGSFHVIYPGWKLSKPQPNLNLTSTQRLGFTQKMTLQPPPPPPTTQTQSQQYLSCYWPDYDETLMVGSWEHLEQTLTVTGTFVQVTFIHIKKISAVTFRNISSVDDMIWT